MRRLWVTLVLAAGLTAPAQADLPTVTSQGLPNGLRLVLAPDTSAASIHVAMCYGLAPLSGPARPASLAAVLADLLAIEPAADPALARGLRGWGATFAHAVRPDAMYFETTAPSEALDAVLEMEAARMRPFEITQERLDAVRAVRRAQWAAAEADPITMGIVELNRAAFRGHTYGRLVGRPDDADAEITPAVLTEARSASMVAANAVLVVAGRFDAAEALQLVRSRFGELPRRPVPRAASQALPQGVEHRIVPLASARTPMVFLGWRGGPASDRDGAALEVLALAIGAGGESLIGSDAGLENAIYGHVEAHFNASRDASLLSCLVVPQPQADRTGTEDELVGKIEFLASNPLPEQDLERAKRQAEARRLFAMQTPAGRARSLAQAWTTTGRVEEQAALDQLRKLTAADVRRAAAKVLVEARRSVVWIVPATAAPEPEVGP